MAAAAPHKPADSLAATTTTTTTSMPRFELNNETEARLLALYKDAPEQRERLLMRIAKAKANTSRLEELRRRKAMLEERNRTLTATVSEVGKESEPANADGNATSAAVTSSYNASTTAAPDVAATPDCAAQSQEQRSDSTAGTTTAATASNRDSNAAGGGGGAPVPEDAAHGKSMYEYSGPAGVVGIVSAVFSDGRLFRIVTEEKEWVFYNDTRDHEMHVHYTLDEASDVVAATANVTDTTIATTEGLRIACSEDEAVTASRRVERLASGKWEACIVVPPERTVRLLRGTVRGFEEHCRAVLLSFDDPSTATDPAAERWLCAEAWAAWAALDRAATADDNTPLPSISTLPMEAGASISSAGLQASEAALAVSLRHGLSFVDPSFFPCHARLYRRGTDAFAIAPLHWRTPRAYLPAVAQGSEALFPSPLQPLSADSVAGGALLPDHSFLSVVAALTAVPGALPSLFTHPEEATSGSSNGSNSKSGTNGGCGGSTACPVARMERMLGAYRVQLCVGGWWRTLLVDAHVPAAQRRPEFARCRDDLRALWLPLLEKAYAKALGSYSSVLEASIADVVAHLTGSVCVPLTAVWPAAGEASASTTEASLAALRRTMQRHLNHPGTDPSSGSSSASTSNGQLLLLRTFPLTLAKSKGRRDRLEEIYRALGLAPGAVAPVLRLEELSSGAAVLQVRQTAPVPIFPQETLDFWRRVGRAWPDALWELELAGGAPAVAEAGTLWMALADVPQFFQEAYALYPMASANPSIPSGEVRARGTFTGRGGLPTVCARLEVSAPTTVLVAVTPREALLQPRPATRPRAGHDRSPVSLFLDAPDDVRGVAVQVAGRSSTDPTVAALLGSSSCSGGASGPEPLALSAELRFAFSRDAAVSLTLTPEGGPYYVVPRASPATAVDASDVPYVLAVLARYATVGAARRAGTEAAAAHVRVSFVEIAPTAPLLQQPKVATGTTALRPGTHAKAVAAEYQICRMVGEQRFFAHGKGIDAV